MACRLVLLCCVVLAGCGLFLPNRGGGEIDRPKKRMIAALDVAMFPGYVIEPVASGLTFPTGVTFDDKGQIYVVEAGYSYGEVFLTPKLVRVGLGGERVTIAKGENGPWTTSSGSKVSSSARSERGGAGSMIKRLPSLRMIASSPGSSNSRGIRTAWLRPFINSLT
jgi:hypothetical protein